MRNAIRSVAAVAATMAVMAAGSTTALAHDVHQFGKVTLALGWLREPAYVGFDNAVQVLVKNGDTPITGITDKDLTVEVSLGSARWDTKPLVPTADPDTGLGIPGEYEMHFIPTAPGSYTFRIKGTVAGQAIEESVTASDKTFDEVEAASEVEFPTAVPANSDLATKLESVSRRAAADRTAADAAQSAANRALYVGVAGVALAVIVGLAGLLSRRRG